MTLFRPGSRPPKKQIEPREFQTTTTPRPVRSDHVWFLKDGILHKCCLCGAVTQKPPLYPTPEEWLPDRYEVLTDKERELCMWKPGIS